MILSRKTPKILQGLFYLIKPIALGTLIILCLINFAIAYKYSLSIQSKLLNLFEISESKIEHTIFENTSRLDILKIDLGLKQLEKLYDVRNDLMEGKKDIGDLDDSHWVRGKIRLESKNIGVKLRLKGVDPEHWSPESRWSFRGKVRGGDNIFGAQRFQLQRFDRLEHVMEWLMMKSFAAENLISHNVNFVNAYMNGEAWGAYIVQNHYDKILIENSQFPEGPILGFNKDSQFDAQQLSPQHQKIWEPDAFWRAPIQITGPQKTLQNPVLRDLAEHGIYLLDRFRAGFLSVSQVFDLEPLAKTVALRAILGAGEFDWRDNKFYVNPITQKLQLISREIHFSPLTFSTWWQPNGNFSKKDQQNFHELFFQDLEFVEKYVHFLNKFSDEEYLNKLLRHLAPEIASLQAKFGLMQEFRIPVDSLATHRLSIRAFLTPPTGAVAYSSSSETDKIYLEIGIVSELPVKIGCLFSGEEIVACPTRNTVLSGKQRGMPVSYSTIEFDIAESAKKFSTEQLDQITLRHSIIGMRRDLSFPVNPFRIAGKESKGNAESLLAWSESGLLNINEEDRIILVNPGLWVVDTNLLFPEGYLVKILPNTTIQLSNGASIISQSELHWVGEAGAEIIFENPSGTGQGIIILSTPNTSRLDHVVFRGLANPIRNNTPLRGAVNFYQSNVEISNTVFEKNIGGDDFLNIVRAKIDLQHSLFKESSADAIDIDFGRAFFKSVSFENTGNDAIDISGTSITAIDIAINGAGDKGISIGENSLMEILGATISDARVGIAVKDLSRLEANQVQVVKTPIGVAIYQKKPEFGPANARFQFRDLNNDLVAVEQFISGEKIVEKGSFLEINSEMFPKVTRQIIIKKIGLIGG